MIERRPVLDFISHAVLIVGAFIIAFPLYVAFVASTQSLEEVMSMPMSLLPGEHLLENYKQVLTAGSTKGSKAAVLDMLINTMPRWELAAAISTLLLGLVTGLYLFSGWVRRRARY